MDTTLHRFICSNSNAIKDVKDKSVQLIVTSPPYPMIEMWDEMFSQQDESIREALNSGKPQEAYLKMHAVLNAVWKECDRVLQDNGFACINIGDATRSIDGDFRMYPNHVQIIDFFQSMGYSVLPDILWRKPSNAPNKFMGSGMYPAGAYVTYEHEYILVFRKGGKREFKGAGKALRQKSAYFWEERNVWFSDLWEIKGTAQALPGDKAARSRNAAFPLEIPYRLVNMYSAEEDTVLDPFCGTGTTTLACMASKRNSIGVDLDAGLLQMAKDNALASVFPLKMRIEKRLSDHKTFIISQPDEKKEKCYHNPHHDCLVKTRQETETHIESLVSAEISSDDSTIVCQYQ